MRNTLKQTMVLVATLLLNFIVEHASAGASPEYLSFDGVLTNNGTPMTGAQSVQFQIYDPSGNCLLYDETRSVTAGSDGSFSTMVGPGAAGGTRVSPGADGGLTWGAIFNNNNASIRASSSTNCSPGYTSATGHTRALRVTVGATTLTPDFKLASSPFATYAETLQGKGAGSFVQITAAITQAKAEALFTSTVYDKLMTLANSGADLNANNTRITGVSTPSAGTDAANKNYCDGNIAGQTASGLGGLAGGDNGKALMWNGTNWVAQGINSLLPSQTSNAGKVLTTDGTVATWQTAGGGGVTSVSVASPLAVATATSTPYINFTAGTVLNDGKPLLAVNGSQPAFAAIDLASPSVVQGALPVTNGGTGVGGSVSQNLVFASPTGASGPPSFRALAAADIAAAGAMDLVSAQTVTGAKTFTGANTFTGAVAFSNPTMSTSMVANNVSTAPLVIQNLHASGKSAAKFLDESSAIGGEIGYDNFNSKMYVTANPGSDFALTVNGVTRMFVDQATGYIGIGTTAPETPLHVNGTILGKPAVDNASSTVIDFETGNYQKTSATCGGTLTLNNLKDGGEYYLVALSPGANNPCNLAGSGLTVKYKGGTPMDAVGGYHIVMRIVVMGTYAYVYWDVM